MGDSRISQRTGGRWLTRRAVLRPDDRPRARAQVDYLLRAPPPLDRRRASPPGHGRRDRDRLVLHLPNGLAQLVWLQAAKRVGAVYACLPTTLSTKAPPQHRVARSCRRQREPSASFLGARGPRGRPQGVARHHRLVALAHPRRSQAQGHRFARRVRLRAGRRGGERGARGVARAVSGRGAARGRGARRARPLPRPRASRRDARVRRPRCETRTRVFALEGTRTAAVFTAPVRAARKHTRGPEHTARSRWSRPDTGGLLP